MIVILKKYIPQSLKKTLRTWWSSLFRIVEFVCVKNSLLASLYYVFFDTSFRREHISVLSGKHRYIKNLQHITYSSTLLRRNIHRLEKGLIMEPRKAIFALDYITATVDNYQKCLTSPYFDPAEKQWAYDVLSEYFSVVDTTQSPVLQQLATEFQNLPEFCPASLHITPHIPYPKSTAVKSDISFEELTKLYQQRRSVRWFKPARVQPELVEQAIDIAALAPSACNRQPYHFHLLVEPDEATQVARLAMGTKGFAENIPFLIVVTGDLASYPYERDRHLIYIDGALASMQLMLALETLGLSSCPINWPDIEKREQKMAKALNLCLSQRPIMLIAVGYAKPQGKIPFSQKKTSALLSSRITL